MTGLALTVALWILACSAPVKVLWEIHKRYRF